MPKRGKRTAPTRTSKRQKKEAEVPDDSPVEDEQEAETSSTPSPPPAPSPPSPATPVELEFWDKRAEEDHTQRRIFFAEEIKKAFGLEMPADFYLFWDWCLGQVDMKTLEADASLTSGARLRLQSHHALHVLREDLALQLVGPFDILAGRFVNSEADSNNPPPSYHLHYRYFYDPPEFLTVLASVSSNAHWGYFRDDPAQMPSFLARSNSPPNEPSDYLRDLTLSPAGDDLFAAVYQIGHPTPAMAEKKQTKGRKRGNNSTSASAPAVPIVTSPLIKSLQDFAFAEAKLAVAHLRQPPTKTKGFKSRKEQVIGPTFSKIGLVVPYNPETELGYRPLTVSESELRKCLSRMRREKESKEGKMDYVQLDHLISLVSLANDECDPGMGLEFGLDLFTCPEAMIFKKDAMRMLSLAYMLLNRPLFGQIIKLHTAERARENVSQI